MQMTENLLEKVTMGERLWEVHCGFAPAPTAYQFGLWLKRWTLRELEYALDRASVKFRHQIMDAATVNYVHRYVTSVMVKQSERKLEESNGEGCQACGFHSVPHAEDVEARRSVMQLDEDTAARARDVVALELWGDRAHLNFSQG